MPKTRTTSPARSQGAILTPRRTKRRSTRSVGSPVGSTTSGRLTSVIQFKEKYMSSFVLSPANRRSILTDNTDIEEPRRKSWWKNLDENSRDVMEVLESNNGVETNFEELIDIEVLSQEKKHYTFDLPDSSDSESISSIVIPQRKLFTQKECQPQKNFAQILGNRESMAKLNKTNVLSQDKTITAGTKNLFNQRPKRTKPVFPAALLNISANKTTADKTKELIPEEPKTQVRNIFGNRAAAKRKNIFADFIVSESEDEIPEIQPKVFGFPKKVDKAERSSAARVVRDNSPTSSMTAELEMDDWKLLPSSTMVENQLEEMIAGTPVKKARLSKLSEAKDSGMATVTSINKSKNSNRSRSSKNKSKSSMKLTEKDLDLSNLRDAQTSKQFDVSVEKRKQNISQSKIDSENIIVNHSKIKEQTYVAKEKNNSQNKTKLADTSKQIESEIKRNTTQKIHKSLSKSVKNTEQTEQQIDAFFPEQNDDNENNFTLEYENDEAEMEQEISDNSINQEHSHHNKASGEDNNKDKEENYNDIDICHKQTKTLNVEDKDEEEEQNENVENVSQQEEIHDDNIEDVNNDVGSDQQEEQEDVNITTNHEEIEQGTEMDVEDDVKYANTSEIQKTAGENHQEEQDDSTIENEQDPEAIAEITDTSILIEKNVANDISRNKSQIASTPKNSELNKSKNLVQTDHQIETDQMKKHADYIETGENQSRIEQNSESHVEESNDLSNADESNEQSNVEESNEKSNAEESNEQIHAEESNEQSNAEQSSEQSNVEESNEKSNAEESNEQIHAEESNEQSNAEQSSEQSNAEQSSEQSNAEESNEQSDDEEENEQDEEGQENSDLHEQIESDADESDQNISAEDVEVDNVDELGDDRDDEEANETEHDESDSEVKHNDDRVESKQHSQEEIDGTPNKSHDTTGRNRQTNTRVKSPEAILHDKTNQIDSFLAHGRNTSVRKTKSMLKSLNIRPSLAPVRESIGFSDGTKDSSAEGSGWDSHRTTRKTIRQTMGKDFSVRKSLRALVMEKSAKRRTEFNEENTEIVKVPQANSTEYSEESTRDDEIAENSNREVNEPIESDHEVSRNTRQTTLEMYLQKIKKQNLENKIRIEEEVRNSLRAPAKDVPNPFKVPAKPPLRKTKALQSKHKSKPKSMSLFAELPIEVVEDMKYKPPKRFQPSNASWITKRLYKFLEGKLEAKYDYKARVRAEKLVETIYYFAKELRRQDVASTDAVDVLKHEMARLDIVQTHFDFYQFFHDFMPREIKVKVVPDLVNGIQLPRHGVFTDILRGPI